MKQRTVKRAVEAWYWIAHNEHQEVGTDFSETRKDENGLPARIAVWFRNHHETMRVPDNLVAEVFAQIKPNRRAFDTRMYALKPKAREAISR